MEYILDRQVFTQKTTIGQWINPIERRREFWTLEDVDRGLEDSMSIEEILAIKVHGQTAIPYGTYEVVISKSPRFGIETPELLGVKAYIAIRAHWGNFAKDTEGCPLMGQDRGQDTIYHSRRAFNLFMPRLRAVLAVERCYVRVTKLYYRVEETTNRILDFIPDTTPLSRVNRT